MYHLKVCFIGIGSIARRHIFNLQTVCADRNIELQTDAYRHREGTGEEGIHQTFYRFEDVPDDYDVIFITNPTEMHLRTLRQFHQKGKHFFIEKPVVSITQLEDASTLSLKNGSIYYVACPLRYHAVIQYIKNKIDPEDIISVRSISSSFLPDWRPGQDYRMTYSAHQAMGGGVSIDLIHEWDYLINLFGEPIKVKSLTGRKSDLEIDSDDYAVYIADFGHMIGELHLDYFGKKTIREIQLFTKEETILGDLVNQRIRFLCSGKEICFHEDRDDYQKRELNHFLDMIENNRQSSNDYFQAIRTLRIAKG